MESFGFFELTLAQEKRYNATEQSDAPSTPASTPAPKTPQAQPPAVEPQAPKANDSAPVEADQAFSWWGMF